MKSAFEIAMARLEEAAGPGRKLTDSQKAEIAEITKKYDARAAEERLSLDGQMAKAATFEELEKLRGELATALTRIEDDREKAKEAVWGSA
ncbi:MAG: hypothetical protein SGI88_15365 [Candidatus Hydrogenedentes bacterium]|nr:hypothetical protein [Candidatus Hydrogenedentota bacterium]